MRIIERKRETSPSALSRKSPESEDIVSFLCSRVGVEVGSGGALGSRWEVEVRSLTVAYTFRVWVIRA